MTTITVKLIAANPDRLQDAIAYCQHYSTKKFSPSRCAAALTYILESGNVETVMDCIQIEAIDDMGVDLAIA